MSVRSLESVLTGDVKTFLELTAAYAMRASSIPLTAKAAVVRNWPWGKKNLSHVFNNSVYLYCLCFFFLGGELYYRNNNSVNIYGAYLKMYSCVSVCTR